MVVANDVNNQPSPADWFKSLPFVTQYWFGATVLLTLTGNFGVVSPMQFMWSWELIRTKFELWRIVACFCYAGPFSFDTLIIVYMLYTMSVRYETNTPYNTGAGGGTADYAFALLFAMVVILASYPILVTTFPLPPLFCQNLVFFVMYIWSKRNPTAQANIWGIPIQAVWLPFAYLALFVCLGNPYFALLHGLAVGHLYYFLAHVFPLVNGRDILVTPKFLIDQFGVGEYRPQRVEERPRDPANRRPDQGGHNWGAGGHALGRT